MAEAPAKWILLEFHGIPTFQPESSGFHQNSWRRVKTSVEEGTGEYVFLLPIKSSDYLFFSNTFPPFAPFPAEQQIVQSPQSLLEHKLPSLVPAQGGSARAGKGGGIYWRSQGKGWRRCYMGAPAAGGGGVVIGGDKI